MNEWVYFICGFSLKYGGNWKCVKTIRKVQNQVNSETISNIIGLHFKWEQMKKK